MADMVPHKIEPAKGGGDAAHDGAGEVVLAQIANQALRAPSSGDDLADHGIDSGLVDVDDADRRSFAGKGNAPARPIPEAAAVTIPILPSSRMDLPSLWFAAPPVNFYAAIPLPS
jgi:hypothetical protein